MKLKTLIIVDVQNDFVTGNLKVPNAKNIIPFINSIIPTYDNIITTFDWHPKDHISFASSHKNKNIGDIIDTEYGKQELWPDHCIQYTNGAKLAEDLVKSYSDFSIFKGNNKSVDSYSAFFDANGTETLLNKTLRNANVHDFDVVGLATDFCVKFTVLDGLRLRYRVNVLSKGVMGFDDTKALTEMKNAGAVIF